METETVVVVVPAYNEASRIAGAIASVPRTISVGARVFVVAVIVVDDCSTDETGAAAQDAGALVIRHERNRGAGAATRTGLRYAARCPDGWAYLITMDADGQHAGRDIERIVTFAVENGMPFVVGNRLHAGNGSTMPWHRVWGNRVLDRIGGMLFGLDHVDTQCGLRLLTPEVLPAASGYRIDRYGFCTEMLWLVRRSGVPLGSLPIDVTYSRDTLIKGQRPWGVFKLLLDLFAVRMTPWRSPQRRGSSTDGDEAGSASWTDATAAVTLHGAAARRSSGAAQHSPR